MTQNEFTDKIDGTINDFVGGAIDDKEFRDDILDILRELVYGTKDENGLLPCPFCRKYPHIGSLGGDKQNWLIWCDCGRALCETGLNGRTKEDIIKCWNDR